ncbi:MAG TPA: LysE family translocator [Phycicoccus sp.]|nr:LysE family translocator [Phycicoccus sp.]
MPSAAHLLAFAMTSVVIVLIPGPSLLFTIGRALSAGRRDAMLTVLGNALGLYTQILGVALGVGPIIAASATAYTVLKVIGAAYLVWLGIQTWRHRREATADLAVLDRPAKPSHHAVRDGYLVGLTNPKTIVFFAALLPQFVDHGAGPVWAQFAILGVVFMAIGIIGDTTFALLAGRARDWFARSPKRMERIGGTGGAMMMALGVGVLFTGRPD